MIKRLLIKVFFASFAFAAVFFFSTEQKTRREINYQGPKMKVRASAYYLPLRGQSRYLTGSYEKEIRRNGRGITFLGDMARVGIIAADPKVLPFNTVLEIPGYGIGRVRDIGYLIKGNRIDVFVGKGEEGLRHAINWGVREIEVIIRSGIY